MLYLYCRYTENRDFLLKAAILDPRFKNMTFMSEQNRFEIFNSIATEAASLHDASLAAGVSVKQEPGTSSDSDKHLPELPQLPPDLQESQGNTLYLICSIFGLFQKEKHLHKVDHKYNF